MLTNSPFKYPEGRLDFFHDGICSGRVEIHDHGNHVSIWGVEIWRALRCRGLGLIMMEETMEYIHQNYPTAYSVELFVERGNERVMKLYELFGFKEVTTEIYVDRYKMKVSLQS